MDMKSSDHVKILKLYF